MVAVASTVRSTAQPSERRWVAAGVALIVAGGALVLAIGAGGPGRTTLALLIVLVGGAVWAGAYTLFGARTACWAGLAAVVLLGTAQLPVRHAAPYEWAAALYGVDQEARGVVPAEPEAAGARTLRVLADATFSGSEAPYRLRADVAGASLAWNCPFSHGHQWLILPLPAGPGSGPSETPVTFRLEGQPNRDNAYLSFFGSFRLPGIFVMSLGDPVSPDGLTATFCQAA